MTDSVLTMDMLQGMMDELTKSMPKVNEMYTTSLLPGLECGTIEDRTYMSISAYYKLKQEHRD